MGNVGVQDPIDSKRGLYEGRKKAIISRCFKRSDSSDLLDYQKPLHVTHNDMKSWNDTHTDLLVKPPSPSRKVKEQLIKNRKEKLRALFQKERLLDRVVREDTIEEAHRLRGAALVHASGSPTRLESVRLRSVDKELQDHLS